MQDSPHCRPEGYMRCVGWVPIEMASALKKDNATARACFTEEKTDFITSHYDTDLAVDGGNFGKRLEIKWGQTPGCWVMLSAGSTEGLKKDFAWRCDDAPHSAVEANTSKKVR